MTSGRGVNILAATARGGWAPESDDRFLTDPALGLAVVADASGPTYGGYHAPFAIDPGLETLRAVLTGGDTGSGGAAADARLKTAFAAANQRMWELSQAHERARGGRTGLAASQAAADAVRPSRWSHLRGPAHFAGSVLAGLVDDGGLVIVGVGSCRAVMVGREGTKVLLREHTLAAESARDGRPSARPIHRPGHQEGACGDHRQASHTVKSS
jgi:serine/threonine protein phosphatase PrpC